MGVVILVLINPLELNMVVPFYGVRLSVGMAFEFLPCCDNHSISENQLRSGSRVSGVIVNA